MVKFSANLGFLWTDRPCKRPLFQPIAGFQAVECHWPYEFDVSQIADILAQTGLPMLGRTP